MTGYGFALHPQHADLLAASGITPEHARARGYVTVDAKVRLADLKVTAAGRNTPGLLVPSLRADGSTWGWQYRPDRPRQRNGKSVKYETPTGQRNGIDVPPGVDGLLGDPAVPLFITEGARKADAAALAGLACVDLPGVWSWIGRNPNGGKVALPEWRDIALNDRRVVLAFDSDVSRKRSVRAALDALAGYLASKGARVEYLHLPDDDPGKTGLDDYLVAGHTADDALRLVRPDPPAVVESAPVEPAAPDAPVSPGRPPGTGAAPETGQLLDEIRGWLARFVCTMDDSDLDLLTLWAAHTHLCVETYTTPRLVLDSPVPGSGKTTVLEHLERLCLHPVQMASLSSPALLTRMLDAALRTVLIDEADRSLRPDKEGVADLLAVLNSGYKRGGTRPVLLPTKDGWTVSEMPTYSPVAMAGNSPNLPEDTQSRSIRVLLMPDVDGLIEESDWEVCDDDARELGRRLAIWADSVRDDVRTHRPDLPEGVRGRARERWAPLKRVADAAGGRWPEVVDTLAGQDVHRVEIEREEGIMRLRPAVALIQHVFEVWPGDEPEPFVATEALIGRLVVKHPDVWGSESTFGKAVTAQRLGRMLVSSYNIHSTRLERTGPRGYTRASFAPAWRRMGITTRESADSSDNQHDNPITPGGYVEATDPVCAGSPDPLSETGASGAAGSTGADSTTAGGRPPLNFYALVDAAPEAVMDDEGNLVPAGGDLIVREISTRDPGRPCAIAGCHRPAEQTQRERVFGSTPVTCPTHWALVERRTA